MSILFNDSFWAAVAAWTGAITAAATIWALILANKASAEKDRKLEKYQQDAAVDIAAANARAEEAKSTSESLKLDIAGANERVAEANLRTAQLEKQTEELRKQNFFLTPRQLRNQGWIDGGLPELRGKEIFLEVVPEPECRDLARDIILGLKMAGCSVTVVESPILARPPWRGIAVWNADRPLVDKLSLALEEAGAFVDWSSWAATDAQPRNPSPRPGQIAITILKQPTIGYAEMREGEIRNERNAAIKRLSPEPRKPVNK